MRYYRKFQWVAEVGIKGYDHETSVEIAEQAVISAAEWTDQMQIQGPAIVMDRRAKLYLSDSNNLEVSLSWVYLDKLISWTDGRRGYLLLSRSIY